MSDWTESELANAWGPRPDKIIRGGDGDWWTGPRPAPPCRVGDRVRLTAPLRNPGSQVIPVESVPVGTRGAVSHINTACGAEIGYQISVRWENGAALDLLPGDSFEVIA